MKIVITWLHKDGRCRSWTNATPCEHTFMCLTAYVDAIVRLAGRWNMTPVEVIEKITDIIKRAKEKDNERKRTNEESRHYPADRAYRDGGT